MIDKEKILLDTLKVGTCIKFNENYEFKGFQLYKNPMYIVNKIRSFNNGLTLIQLKHQGFQKERINTFSINILIKTKFRYRGINYPYNWIESDTLFDCDNVHSEHNEEGMGSFIGWGFEEYTGDNVQNESNYDKQCSSDINLIKKDTALESKIEMFKDKYNHNRYNVQVGEYMVCPVCNKSLIKKTYHNIFCGTSCKDYYWNTIDEKRRIRANNF